jgi:hypothetical protein
MSEMTVVYKNIHVRNECEKRTVAWTNSTKHRMRRDIWNWYVLMRGTTHDQHAIEHRIDKHSPGGDHLGSEKRK